MPIVFTHGLGADGDEWSNIRHRLSRKHRLIDWDLPGLGRSAPPRDGDWSVDRLARDLKAVLEVANGRPAILVGHSLGGMVLLTYCRLFPQTLGRRVAGLVLAHTTYTNPVQTTASPRLYTALQKPVWEPMCRLTIGLSPLLRVLNLLMYLNGSAHRSLERTLFTGRESWEVLDHLARYFVRDQPAAVARWALAMFGYDETATLGTIRIPTLVVAGDKDERVDPDAQAFMCARIPGARLLTLRPAKHGGLLEYPQRFSAAVEMFARACATQLAV
jgi:pimeloyl-ACP methyl ester carboxylesterase